VPRERPRVERPIPRGTLQLRPDQKRELNDPAHLGSIRLTLGEHIGLQERSLVGCLLLALVFAVVGVDGLILARLAIAQDLPPGVLLLSRVKNHIKEELQHLVASKRPNRAPIIAPRAPRARFP
jgi:hypothetical protein